MTIQVKNKKKQVGFSRMDLSFFYKRKGGEMNLHQPLSVLPGVGPKSVKDLKLGIETLEDLFVFPLSL